MQRTQLICTCSAELHVYPSPSFDQFVSVITNMIPSRRHIYKILKSRDSQILVAFPLAVSDTVPLPKTLVSLINWSVFRMAYLSKRENKHRLHCSVIQVKAAGQTGRTAAGVLLLRDALSPHYSFFYSWPSASPSPLFSTIGRYVSSLNCYLILSDFRGIFSLQLIYHLLQLFHFQLALLKRVSWRRHVFWNESMPVLNHVKTSISSRVAGGSTNQSTWNTTPGTRCTRHNEPPMIRLCRRCRKVDQKPTFLILR